MFTLLMHLIENIDFSGRIVEQVLCFLTHNRIKQQIALKLLLSNNLYTPKQAFAIFGKKLLSVLGGH